MAAIAGPRYRFERGLSEPWRQHLARQGAGVLLALVVGAALLLGWRRVTGALERPLAPATFFAVGLSFVGAVSAMRLCAASPFTPRVRRWIDIVASVALLLAAMSVSLPGTSTGGLILFWMALLGTEVLAWSPWRRRVVRRFARTLESSEEPRVPVESGQAPPDRAQPDDAPGLLQRIVRTRTPEGLDTLSGWLRVELAAGQRTATAHVAFCPPFVRPPLIEIAFDRETSARIKVAQVLAYGARFDVKLSVPAAESQILPLRFTASSDA